MHQWSWIFFVSFVPVAAFILLNVLIGIALNSMEEARELERRKALGIDVGRAARRHRLPSESPSCVRRSTSSSRSSRRPTPER